MPPPPPLHKASPLADFLIQQCKATTSLSKARQLHALLLTSATTASESQFLHNNVLSMYGRCGSFLDAQLLFDKMPQRNIVSYNILISAYSRSPRHARYAFRLFDRLGNEGLSPSGLTFTGLLQASAGVGSLVTGCSLHGQCVKLGFLNNDRVQTSLLGMYSSCGDVKCAKRVFCSMVDKDAIAWNSIISGYAKNGKIIESLELFHTMLWEGVNPTQFTYSLVLNACAKLEDHDCGRLVHAQVLSSGTYIDLPLHNALLDMYCSCSDTHTAFKVFSRIQNPDLVSWNSMMGGYSDNGDGEKAMDLFVQFMRLSLAKPDDYTFAAAISGTSGFPSRNYGKPLHAQTEKTGLARSVYIGSRLISMYFNNDDYISSQKIFSSFLHKDAVLWTDMIAGHVRMHESEVALNFFLEMSEEGFKLDSFTLSSALSACADLVTLRQGEMIHCLALKTGNDNEVCVHGSLVDMYAKNGELKAATCVFSCLPKCDLKCWNSMLTGYGNHGKSNEAFQVFYKMLKNGIRPDEVTFLSLLAACSHCGLVDKCRHFWNCMKENGLKPGPKHYSCMISLLSRAGLWEEAEEMIIESPFVDSYLESWRTVLSSCIRSGNLGVGINAAEQILNVDSEGSGASVLLMKLYGAAGRWEDVAETRRKMRKSMVEKEPGLSWIEVRNDVHVFCSGDQSHLQNDQVRGELSNLMGNFGPTVVEEIT